MAKNVGRRLTEDDQTSIAEVHHHLESLDKYSSTIQRELEAAKGLESLKVRNPTARGSSPGHQWRSKFTKAIGT